VRRHALGLIASGAVLLGASAIGAAGTWATIAAVVLLTLGAFVLAIVMEDATAHVTPTRAATIGGPGRNPDLAA
jgi:hypothetical protein